MSDTNEVTTAVLDEEINNMIEADPPRPEGPVVQVRKVKKKKRVGTSNRNYDVQVIPATKGVTPLGVTPQAK